MLLPPGNDKQPNGGSYQAINIEDPSISTREDRFANGASSRRGPNEHMEIDAPQAVNDFGKSRVYVHSTNIGKISVPVPKKVLVTFCLIITVTIITAFLSGFYADSIMESAGSLRATLVRPEMKKFDMVMHISDTHIDPYFDPTQSMKAGVCHPCNMSTSIFGSKTWCPLPNTLKPTTQYAKDLSDSEFAFGRYGCNPPYRLWHSLHHHMHKLDPDPKVIIFTGDISPHGYPDDDTVVTEDTRVKDLCETKFLITKMMIEELVAEFPNAKWAYTMGNNDHFPKDEYWKPYMKRYADMLLETKFLTKSQYNQFLLYGSNYLDVDNIRYLSIDMTLFMQSGEIHFKHNHTDDVSVRHRVVEWVKKSLQEAREKSLNVYLVGHQPLETKRGKDELEVNGVDYERLKDVLMDYADVIKVGFFGHRNLAGIHEVLSPDFLPLFPAITAPGVSPRGKNQPSFHVIYKDPQTGVIQDFEQWYFDMLAENHQAKREDLSYLGTWHRHDGSLFSWRTLSKETEFTEETLHRFIEKVPHSQRSFEAIELWRKAGYIGDETPISYKCKSLYDVEEVMMTCLFPNQDVRCWDTDWLT